MLALNQRNIDSLKDEAEAASGQLNEFQQLHESKQEVQQNFSAGEGSIGVLDM